MSAEGTKTALAMKPNGSLDRAIGIVAINRVAQTKPEEFLAELKKQGINNLEDLVSATLESARTAARRGGLEFDDELHEICYKFTMYRPHFSDQDINQIINVAKQTVYR